MSSGLASLFSLIIRHITQSLRSIFRRRLSRKLLAFSIVASLIICPGSDTAFKLLPAFAETALAVAIDTSKNAAGVIRLLLKPGSTASRQETLADRLAQVARIQITPGSFVGYQNQPVAFAAIARNTSGRTVQGVKFTWQSSDLQKVQIDDSSQALFLQPTS